VSADTDAESALRTAVLEFVDTVRRAERAIGAARRGDSVTTELDVAPLGEVTEEEWREHWSAGEPAAIDEAVSDSGAKPKASGKGSKRPRGRR